MKFSILAFWTIFLISLPLSSQAQTTGEVKVQEGNPSGDQVDVKVRTPGGVQFEYQKGEPQQPPPPPVQQTVVVEKEKETPNGGCRCSICHDVH